MRRNLAKIDSDGISRITSKNYDIEKYQEELQKMKLLYNKSNNSYNELKVEYNKLEKDYKNNIKFLELIMNKANISALDDFLDNGNSDNTNNTGKNTHYECNA